MRIAVVGARMSGTYAALLLAGQGHAVSIFDDTLARPKPCGGGVTEQAPLLRWLLERGVPHVETRFMDLAVPAGGGARLPLRHPIRIFSRGQMESALLAAARASGVRVHESRVRRVISRKEGWALRTDGGEWEADFLVGADGAAGITRAATAGPFEPTDLSLSLGYYLPGSRHPGSVAVRLQEQGFRGYLWSFPNFETTSVGILRWQPEARAADLRARVNAFIAERFGAPEGGAVFYAALIPCLSRRRLLGQRVCGRTWALVGDAAGFADAITAEGIRYAWRSAELAAAAVGRGAPLDYESLWRADFGRNLARAAAWRDRFYTGAFLMAAFTRRAAQALRYSPQVRSLTDLLVAGRLSYSGLRRKIVLGSPHILAEVLSNRASGMDLGAAPENSHP